MLSSRHQPRRNTDTTAAGRFSSRCSCSFALRTSLPLTGRERRIHRFFPSSETEGVDTTFMPQIIPTPTTTSMGR